MAPVRTALQAEAERRGLWRNDAGWEKEMDLPGAFLLVREMPYGRASSWEPLTVIREWRGTCSSKHLLLQKVCAELGLTACLMACTQRLSLADGAPVPPLLEALLVQGPFVDVHNYLVLELPAGPMLMDATWPLAARAFGIPVNEQFVWGQDMRIACRPLQTYRVPDDEDPRQCKERLLRQHFTKAELTHRERFIRALGQLSALSS